MRNNPLTFIDPRGEFFNIPNHPIFANPGLSVGTLSYGVIGATVVDSRQVQFDELRPVIGDAQALAIDGNPHAPLTTG